MYIYLYSNVIKSYLLKLFMKHIIISQKEAFFNISMMRRTFVKYFEYLTRIQKELLLVNTHTMENNGIQTIFSKKC